MTRIFLGHISAANGLNGDVLVKSQTGDPQAIGDYGPLSNEAGDAQYQLRVKRVTAKGVIAHIAGVDTRDGAEALRGTKLFIAREKLPAANDGEFYIVDLIGLNAERDDGTPFGRIIDVQNYGAGDLLEIKPVGGGATELVPFTKVFVPHVDMPARKVVVALDFVDSDEDDPDQPGARRSADEKKT